MVPKIIHYCWFGENQMPNECKRNINGWRKVCPDYEIVEWNEKNFDINCNSYCREAYLEKRWAFVSDYARLKIVYEYGGIYLDTDVEVLKDITSLVEDGYGYIGFENFMEVNTGLGFAAAPKNECVKAMLDVYRNRNFRLLKNNDEIPCPAANTLGLLKCGLLIDEKHRNIIQCLKGIKVYPQEYFNPIDYDTQSMKITKNTYSIHHYASSWCGSNRLKTMIKKMLPRKLLEYRLKNVIEKQMHELEGYLEEK